MPPRKPDSISHIKGLLIETVENTTGGHVICEDGTEADLPPQSGEDIEQAWNQAEHLCENHVAPKGKEVFPDVNNLSIRTKGNEQRSAFSSVGICKDGRTERSISTLPHGQNLPEDFLTTRLEELQDTCKILNKEKE